MSDMNLQERAPKRKGQGSTRADATGNVLMMRGRVYIRIPVAKGKRPAFHVPWAMTEDEARPRAALMATMARDLRSTGEPSHLDVLPKILERAAVATDAKRLEELRGTVDRLVAGKARVAPLPVVGETFQSVGEMWTSGELARRFPHHLKEKRSASDDAQRLEKFVYPFVGSVRAAAFNLDDAERAMGALPPELAPATRRQIAQLIRRVMTLAEFPLRLVTHNPIPAGWLPRVPKSSQKKQATLYPSEADLFVAGTAPLSVRLFVGFVAREGMRHDEAERLTWSDIERGIVRLNENKTDDKRAWALRPGVARALEAWREISPRSADSDLVFVSEDGSPLRLRTDVYRSMLKASGIEREDLFTETTSTKPTAIHALRALFVTEALARGESESWVTDRTGHKSSAMVATYKRRARTFDEANLAHLGELDRLLGLCQPANKGTVSRHAAKGLSTIRPVFALLQRLKHKRSQPSTEGGSRTHKPVRTADFESAAFAIPPLRHAPVRELNRDVLSSDRMVKPARQKVPITPAVAGPTNGRTLT